MGWPLLLCSVLGFGIIVDRTIIYFRSRYSYGKFAGELRHFLSGTKDLTAAIATCDGQAHPLAAVSKSYLESIHHPDSLRTGIVARQGSMELERLDRRLRMLSAIGHLTPLMGLLGTVMGMVSAFAQIDMSGGNVQPGQLASGIWEALLTTVIGLMIAIPCLAAFHAFESHVDRVARQMRFIVTTLDEWFGMVTPPPATPG